MKEVFSPVNNKEDINTDIKEELLKATTRLGRILPSKFQLQQTGDSSGRQYWGQSGQVSAWSLVAVLLSDPNMAGPEPECRESKEDQEKSNAHSCWEICIGEKVDLYPLPIISY